MKSSIHSLAIALVALLFPAFAGFSALAQTGEWPQWRGADRSNASQETNLLKEWPAEGPPLLWRVTGLGDGIHSVSVAGGRVFTVGNREGGEFVFALDAKTGEKLWATRMGDVVAENPLMRWLTQRTPTVDGDRVYAFSSSGELICLGSADGRKVWRRSYPNDFGPSGHPWGFCDRPMVDGEWLICAPLSTKAFITALNKRTGESIWQTRMDYPSSGYGALVATEAGGVKQYVMLSMRGLSAFAADDGRLLWEHPRPMQIAATYTPIAVGEYICSPNGFRGGLLGFQLVPDDTGFAVRDLYWSYAFTFDPFEDSTARVGDYLYILHRPTFKDVSFGTTIV